MTVNKKLTGSLAALTANVIFGFSNFFSVKALGFAEPLVILSLRFTVAFAALCLMRIFGLIKLSYKGKKLTGLVLMCLAQPLCYFLSELYGIDMTSSSFSGVLGFKPIVTLPSPFSLISVSKPFSLSLLPKFSRLEIVPIGEDASPDATTSSSELSSAESET